MKWTAIGFGVAAVAFVAAGLTVALRTGGAGAYEVVTSTDSFVVSGVKQTAVTTTVARDSRRAPACRGGAADESDTTGDDRSPTRASCPADREAASAQDNQAGDGNSDEGGDNQAGGRGGDNQAGDNQRGGD